jgi:hypothetical protein
LLVVVEHLTVELVVLAVLVAVPLTPGMGIHSLVELVQLARATRVVVDTSIVTAITVVVVVPPLLEPRWMVELAVHQALREPLHFVLVAALVTVAVQVMALVVLVVVEQTQLVL